MIVTGINRKANSLFIPIRDDAPTYRTPYVTVSLIAVNVLIFIYMFFLNRIDYQMLVVQFGYIPYELTHMVELTPEIPASIYLTPFTSMFLHGGFFHLAGNMLVLWVYGNNVEDYFGPVKFILFYLLSGLAAVALFTLFGFNSQTPLIGASGAIAGVMGAYMVLHPKARITVLVFLIFITFIDLPAKVVLGIWFAWQLLMSISGGGGGVAWMAHVGGFVFGYLILKFIVKFFGRGNTPSGGQRVYRMQW